jgi:hypothetical protein
VLLAGQRIGQAVDRLERARATARGTVRLAPGRRAARPAVARAERSAADFVALTSTVLTIGSLTVAAAEAGEPLPAELRESIGTLRAALAAAAAGSPASADIPAASGSPSAAAATAATTASTGSAAVIALLAASCAALTDRAAGPGTETGADAEPR